MKFEKGTYKTTVEYSPDLVLDFPDGNKPTIRNSDFHDGSVDIQWASQGDVFTITLTGLSEMQDMMSYSLRSFNSLFDGVIV